MGISPITRARLRLLRRIVATFVITYLASSAGAEGQQSRRILASQKRDLRGAFLSPKTVQESDEVVGRIVINLIRDGIAQRVSLTRPFRSGERFQFEVTANRDGWVWVIHKSPRGDLQLLWPPAGARGLVETSNQIRARVPQLIPADPDSIEFDQEVGIEEFFIAISRGPDPLDPSSVVQLPTPSRSAPGARETLAAPGAENAGATAPGALDFSNIDLRKLASESTRGVVLRPSAKSSNPYTYFAPSSTKTSRPAVIYVQVIHVQ